MNVHVDAAWKALEMKTRSPGKFTDVSDVMVLMRILSRVNWDQRCGQRYVCQPFTQILAPPLNDERVFTDRLEPNLHLEFLLARCH